MAADSLISARVTAGTKARFAAVARYQGLSESALLKNLVDGFLTTAVAVNLESVAPVEPVARSGKMSVRLRPNDLLLLRERASARSLPTGTYVSLLIRSHLRSLAPLPTAEFDLLRQTLMEVGAIGRNLNQIARALNSGERDIRPNAPDLQALVRALLRLRDHFRGLLDANLSSWELGYEKKTH